MKSFGSTSLQDEQRPQSRNSQHHLHTTTTSPFPSKPSSSNNATGLTMNSGVSNTGKRHGFSLGRFSLRRFLNPSTFTRTVVGSSNSKQPKGSQAHQAHSKDLHTDNSSTGENKVLSNVKGPTFCPNYSSTDFESNSISSGPSEFLQAESSSSGYHFTAVASGLNECPLCLLELPMECFPQLATCSHRACYDCLQQYLKIEISESRVNVSCPECTEPIHPNDIQMILNDEIFLIKYESFMLRRVLAAEPDARWCPAPDCSYVVIAAGCASCPKLRCARPGCDTFFCYHCKQEWHPNQTCDAARAQRHGNSHHSPNPRSSSVTFSHDSITQRDDIKPCPCCKVLIIKMDDGSCNHITCSVCGTEFCWLCMKEISDLHYLSPSGCTFWGKKPWSRKKKIMWQLGMLIGAPVGIALIAGIAVPAIIIGIPVWVGRKLHSRFERQSMSRHKRNFLVASGVVSSIFVSPILAAVAVGIGIPILLAYVYGVVPISLCRSGGCGVTTSSSGVRIEMDEENEIGLNAAPDGLSVDTALSNKGVNPSIGEVSLGMSTSLSMGSGSHLDRTGADRESASNAALAGSIASAVTTSALETTRLDVQADLSSNKRFSFSSHSETASATVSLSEKSANLSFLDDASTKALAGSIVGYRDVCIGTSNAALGAVTPVEVHVDAVTNCGCHVNCFCDETKENKNKELQTQVNDSGVAYIDDGNNTSESVTVNISYPSAYTQVSPRCVSFQSNHGNRVKIFESRSLEQIANYCEVCNKTHRPCCPNYTSPQENTTQSTTPSTGSSVKGRYSKVLKDEVPKNCMIKHSAKSTHSEGHRKASIKSTHSDHLELKRVKSSEYQHRSSKKIKPKSTPTSPIESSTLERAYHSKSTTKPILSTANPFKGKSIDSHKQPEIVK